MKNKFFRNLFAFMFVVMSGLILTACGTADFDTSKIKVGSTTFVYDGQSHVCEIDYDVEDVSVSVTYSTTADGEFKSADELEFKNVGSYSVYYKLSAEGYNDYISDEPVEFVINTAVVSVSNITELKTALSDNVDGNYIIALNADLDFKEVNNNTALKIESGKVVIDLNGHKLTGVDNGSNSWHVIDVRGANTELTITDSSSDKTGTIQGRCYGIHVSRGAKLTIDGGNFICTTNGTFNQNIVVYGGTLVINGGTFTSKVYETIYASSYIWNSTEYHTSVTINGGTFNSTDTDTSSNALLYFGNASSITEPQKVIINGGTFNNNNLQYVVHCDANVDFTNNAQIPANKIDA